jgi:hypothetical protein
MQVPGADAAARGGVCPPAGLPLEHALQGLQTGEQLTSLYGGGGGGGGEVGSSLNFCKTGSK